MKISIFGLGHVGAVSAACFASLGHSVIGLDSSDETRSLVARGQSACAEPGLEGLLHAAVSEARLTVSDDAQEAVRATEVSLVCVGTPARVDGAFDAEALRSVSQEIGTGLTPGGGHIVVVRSTVLPGTTRDIVVPILERVSGLRAGVDFAVAAAPEFLRESTALEDFFTPPQVVIGADDRDVALRVAALFNGIEGPLTTTSIEVAETTKYVSNAWHGLKVAFANEIGALCRSIGVDGVEVMRIFADDRKLNLSAQYLRPGFAFGGPCLAKDIDALTRRADELGLSLPVLSSILPSNENRIEEALELILRTGKRAIAFLGVSYKADTDDLRFSPYLELCRRLVGKGCGLRIFDPFLTRSPPAGANRANTLDEALRHAELVVIGARHRAFADVRRRLMPTQSLIDLG